MILRSICIAIYDVSSRCRLVSRGSQYFIAPSRQMSRRLCRDGISRRYLATVSPRDSIIATVSRNSIIATVSRDSIIATVSRDVSSSRRRGSVIAIIYIIVISFCPITPLPCAIEDVTRIKSDHFVAVPFALLFVMSGLSSRLHHDFARCSYYYKLRGWLLAFSLRVLPRHLFQNRFVPWSVVRNLACLPRTTCVPPRYLTGRRSCRVASHSCRPSVLQRTRVPP